MGRRCPSLRWPRGAGDNTLIQHGGWWLIALALGIAASGYWASRGTRGWWLPVLLCVIAAVLLVVTVADKGNRTPYPGAIDQLRNRGGWDGENIDADTDFIPLVVVSNAGLPSDPLIEADLI